MSISDIDHVIDTLVEKTGHSRNEITNMIAEIEKENELVGRTGAAYLLAHNLGVAISDSTPTETLTIDILTPGQSNVTILGRVNRIFPTRTFTRKDNTSGKVRNIEIKDNTGTIRVALWDSRADEIEQKSIEVGDVIKISGANAKAGYQDSTELSLGNQSMIDKVTGSSDDFPEADTAEQVSLAQVREIDDGKEVSVKGKLIDRRDKPTEFERKDGSTGRVTSIQLADTTASMRITFWDNSVDKIMNYDRGSVLAMTNLAVGSSDYGKELTFRDYSIIKQIEDDSLAAIEQASSGQQQLDNLDEVQDNMKNITVTGKIAMIGRLNSFERDGDTNYVSNIEIQDKTKQIRVTLWREKAQLVNQLGVGQVVRISNATSKYSTYSNAVELSVNDYSELEVIDADPADYELEMEIVPLGNITESRRRVAVKVQLQRHFDINTISRDDGTEARVMNATVIDSNDGSRGRLAAWDDQIPRLDDILEGEVIVLTGVSVKPASGEYPPSITINSNTTIEKLGVSDAFPIQSASDLMNDPTNYEHTTLDKLVPGSRISVKATIVEIYSPQIYHACPECRKKVKMEPGASTAMCANHDEPMEVEPNPSMILKLILDDSTATASVTAFTSTAESLLGMSADDARDLIERMSDPKAPINAADIELKEVVVEGRVVTDDYSGQEELKIQADRIELVDLKKANEDFLSKFD